MLLLFCFFSEELAIAACVILQMISLSKSLTKLMVNTSRAQNPECLVSGYETGLRIVCKQSTLIVYLPSQDDKLGGPVKEVSFCVYAYLDSISKPAIM